MKVEYFSWSQINMLHRCGEQYRRRYLENETLPPGIAMLRGRATHKANEENLVSKMETGKLMNVDAVRQSAADAFDEATKGEYVLDGEYQDLTVSEALGHAKDEAVSLAGLHAEKVAPAIEPSGIELRIEIPASEALPARFVSVLDVIDREVYVRDTKTSRKSPPITTADQSDQLTGQALAFQARYGRAPEGLSLDYLVRTPKRGDLSHRRLDTSRSKEDLAVFVRRSRAALHMIESEVFLPAPVDSWQCSTRFCGYAQTCPFFRGRPRAES